MSPIPPADTLREFTVLYVEDDAMAREQMECFLRRRVGMLHVAGDGQAGLELWRQHRPQIVITDIMMPVMDGLKMAAAIRADAPGVPIIVTTAYNEAEHFLRAIDIGIDQYVVKPINGDRLENALHKCAQELRASRDRQLATTVFEASSNAIMVTDAAQRILMVNAAFGEITGYGRAEVLGHTPALLASGQHDAAFYATMHAELASHGHWAGEVCNRRKSGELYTEWLTINAVRHEADISHYVAIFTDITVQKHQQVELQAAKSAAEAASLAKSQFLATMSHEIRTPMNGILGMAQMLQIAELDVSQRQEYARVVIDSGKTLLALLNDILDFSQIEVGKLRLSPARIDPAQIVTEVSELFAEAARAKGLRIASVWHGPTGQRYLADPLRLRQMLSNLLSNAIKFTERGDIRVSATALPDGRLEFSVADTGIGIADAERTKLFQPFSQVDGSTTRRYGGTGLGLSIVRTLAQLMDGNVAVDSVPGQGSTFRFHIHAGQAPADAAGEHVVPSETHQEPVTAIASPRTCRILVAEDNAMNQMVVKAVLQKCGYDYRIVADGAAAVALCTEGDWHPDLVLMDCQMPTLNGYEATVQIRAWEQQHGCPRMPIIALTASAFAEDRARCDAVGMDDFVAKPVDVKLLQATLRRWLVDKVA